MWRDQSSYAFGIREIFGIVRRRIFYIVVGSLLGLVVGVVLIAKKETSYTATTAIHLESYKARALEKASVSSSNNSNSPIETDLKTEIEVIKSDRIAAKVFDALEKSPDGLSAQSHEGPASLLHTLRVGLSETLAPFTSSIQSEAATKPEPQDERMAAIADLRNNVSVRLVPQTTVLELSFTDPDPVRAAQLSRAFAKAYMAEQQQYLNEVVDQVTAWLRTQIAEMKQLVQKSDQEIDKFKTERGIITASGGLLDDQRLTDAHNRLIAARAETGRIQARYEKLQSIIQKKSFDAILGEGLIDPLIAQLRIQYLSIMREERESKEKLGPQHASVIRLRASQESYEELMLNELRRMADTSRNEFEIAQSREAALVAEFNELIKKNAKASASQVELRELERPNQTYRAVYNGLLERYQEAVQRQELDNPNTRIITEARVPQRPNGLSSQLILGLGLFFGAVVGGGLGFARDLSDRTIRTRQQLRDDTGVTSIWMMPYLGRDAIRHVLNSPRSYATERLQAIKLELDLVAPKKKCPVVGVVACLPGEGATTVAANLASLIAQTGAKALLIDADIRKAGLTRILAPTAEKGLIEALGKGKPLLDFVAGSKEIEGRSLLPVIRREGADYTANVLASPRIGELIEEARQNFDYVIVDFPPMALSADAHAMAEWIDVFVVVAAWGKITRMQLADNLDRYGSIRDKCLGIVLNKTNMRKLRLYEAFNTQSAYNRHYAEFVSSPRAG